MIIFLESVLICNATNNVFCGQPLSASYVVLLSTFLDFAELYVNTVYEGRSFNCGTGGLHNAL